MLFHMQKQLLGLQRNGEGRREVGVQALENCAYLWKNPGYARAVERLKLLFRNQF